MSAFRTVALLQAHPRLPLAHVYYISDLVELCGLAAFIRDRVDEVSIPVTPTDRDPLSSFERFMRKRRPELVGVSSFTSSAKSALHYADIAKRFDATVVMGGYHPSALPDEVLSSRSVDVVVRGEGELTFDELVSGVPLEGIAGISYKHGDDIVHNPDRPLIDDLDVLPIPIREIRPPRFGLSGLDYHTDTVYASRGCRARCSFCANHLVGKKWRQRSTERVLEELLTILPPRRGPWKYVKFWDPNFMTDPNRVDELCDLILENGLENYFRFVVETRVEDVIRAHDILRKMRSAGFTRIGCGVESPNHETHKILKKGINLSHVRQATELISSSNILISKFFIIGNPGESAEDILSYPEYSLSHGVELQNTVFMMMTPYPGTEIAEHFRQQGELKSHDWDLYTNFGAVVEPEGISLLQLQTLLCAVTAKYGMVRRFLLGHRFPQVVARLFEALLSHVMVARLNRDFTTEDVQSSLWNALCSIRLSEEREGAAHARRRLLDRVAIHFHIRNRQPVVVEVTATGASERLSVRLAEGSARTRRGLRAIHVWLPHLVSLADNVNLRRLAHDVLALRLNLRSFRPSWLPGLAWELARVSLVAARIVVFQLRASLGYRAGDTT